jgi:hypothetical protein
MTLSTIEMPTIDPDCLTSSFIYRIVRSGARTSRNKKCGYCNSSRTDYRVRTKDIRCKDCKGITPIRRTGL